MAFGHFTAQRARHAAVCFAFAVAVTGCGAADAVIGGEDDELGDSIDPLVSTASFVEEDDLTAEEQAVAAVEQTETQSGLMEEANPPVDPNAAAKEAAARAFAQSEGLTTIDEEEAAFDPTKIDARVAAVTRSDRAKIKGYKQINNHYCAPASGRTVLSAFDATPPTQKRIANRMDTTRNGTLPSKIPGALNHFQSKNTYILSSAVEKTGDLITRLKLDLKNHNAPTLAAVQAGVLPTWARHGFVGGHAIVVYGWTKTTGRPYKVMTWDPLRVSWSGAHTFRASRVVLAMKTFGPDNFVW